MFYVESDLIKAVHKYVKRTGSPGNYKYWYKLPDGRVVAEDTHQESGKAEHLKRLIAGRMRGIHSKTNEQIAGEVGVDRTKVGQHERNMRRPTSTTHTDFHESHLHEAHTDVNHESYEGHTRTSATEADSEAGPARRASPRASRPATTRPTSPTPTASERPSRLAAREARPAVRAARELASDRTRAETPAPAEAPARATPEQTKAAKIAEKRQKLKELFGVDLSAPSSGPTPEAAPEVAPAPESSSTSNQEAPTPAPRANRVEDASRDLDRARSSVARAEKAARAATLPTAPHATELRATDPVLDRDEEALASDIAEQAAGGNPYMKKAKSIFERISHNVKEERRKTVGHIMQALDYLKDEDRPINKQNLIEEYNRISGRRVRELGPIGDEFEKATFYSLDEVMNNPQIDPEVERMKRGYAAKQFARALPYLKPSWIQANAGAPPPHPTFADFKSWSEHGGVKPEWAGSTRLAVPKEIFDAAPKGADGKPKYPPAWMPLHMMPIWNYAYKKMGSDDAYQAQGTGISRDQSNRKTGFKIDMGDQASFQEGMIKSAIRKYVQMRGGADQLTDIPSSKLVEAGLTHADIYKSEDDIERILQTKIVDNMGLMPFLKKEIKENKPIKKSVVFEVSADALYKSSPKRDTEAEILKKAELINKIKKLKKSMSNNVEFVIGIKK